MTYQREHRCLSLSLSLGIGIGADSMGINAKQPGENWSVQLVAQHGECADDVVEGHTCDDECL
jgi:hypothetical protein